MPPCSEVRIDNRLQAMVHADSANGWAVLLTHPHPKLGGDMDNNVVYELAEGLAAQGFAVVRFNTRGVGESKGWSTWRGIDEREDVVSAGQFASRLPNVAKVCLCAYSFGAAVGCSVANDIPKLAALIVIGYPKGFWASFLFRAHYAHLRECAKSLPKLFILGDCDNFTSVSTMEELVAACSDPKELAVLQGCDHFFFDREHQVLQLVQDWLHSKM
jgi:alpha/beta superfamily hydrolase